MRVDQKETLVDQIDDAIATLRTAELALWAEGMLDEAAIRDVRTVLNNGLRRLEPVREHLNREHGRS